MDAEAVRYSLNRHLTLQGSFRRGEISTMEAVEVVDPKTVRIRLKEPSSPFLSQLTDRAGMIVTPKAAEAAGAISAPQPVCAGPYRFVERVAQDRIVVERFPDYWDAGRSTSPHRPTSRSPTTRCGWPTCNPARWRWCRRIEPDDMQAGAGQPQAEGRRL